MNISLLNDGKFKILKNKYHIYNLIYDTKYLVMDISTALKGKTCTLIDVSKKPINIFKKDMFDLLGVEIELEYGAVDTPMDSEPPIKSIILFNSIEKIFSVYPLVKQMFGLNYFKEVRLSTDYILLFIRSILVKSKVSDIKFNCDDLDGKVGKYFKKLNIKTDVDNTLDPDQHIILKEGMWHISKDIPNKFDYILYHIIDIETLYILTEKQYNRFLSIKYLNVYLYDNSKYDEIEDYFGINDECLEDNMIYDMSCSDINSILETCVYLPQLIELERFIFNKNFHVVIELQTKYMTYKLDITEEETRKNGICLFKIINKLLQM
jgi:hypothetical protein